jgi:hypothetical protein
MCGQACGRRPGIEVPADAAARWCGAGRCGPPARVLLMNFGLALLETERELPIPAWGFGLIAFVILHLMLFITIGIGKGRPHS